METHNVKKFCLITFCLEISHNHQSFGDVKSISLHHGDYLDTIDRNFEYLQIHLGGISLRL